MLKHILLVGLLSFSTLPLLKAQSCGNDEKYHLPYKNTYVKAVSYTHLDVYKRQHKGCLLSVMKILKVAMTILFLLSKLRSSIIIN